MNFNFTKAFMNSKTATTHSNYVKMDELKRLEKINDIMTGKNMQRPEKIVKIEESDINRSIYQDRVNALKGIKKD